MASEFSERVISLLKRVPKGKVVTYGALAAYAGNPRGARQVVRVINTYWEREKLPWHRVINREGKISLAPGQGYELQKAKLKAEGARFDKADRVDLERCLWIPRKVSHRASRP